MSASVTGPTDVPRPGYMSVIRIGSIPKPFDCISNWLDRACGEGEHYFPPTRGSPIVGRNNGGNTRPLSQEIYTPTAKIFRESNKRFSRSDEPPIYRPARLGSGVRLDAMATLPRAAAKSPTASKFMSRPPSEFDAGINASAAWTEHLERGPSYHQTLSDDEETDLEREHGRPARALYDFEGKPEYRELSFAAGVELRIIKELQEGWSLANCNGEVGLVPKSYYIFTAEFKSSPSAFSHSRQRTVTDNDDVTPRTSPRNTPPPLMPQATGDWTYFPSFRQSLLGGKSLNRFSSFVTTGAEDWVLNGSEEVPQEAFSHSRDHSRVQPDEDEDENEDEEQQDDSVARERAAAEANKHFVEAGPAWRSKLPPFRVLVHTPEKRTHALTGAYTIYHVTSLFYAERADDDPSPPPPPTRITVHRRFSHFVFLHTALSRRLPGLALPPLPEKQYAGRFSQEFVEARRGDLERYLARVVRHPVARYAEAVTFFLSCESEQEWRRLVPQHMNLPPAGPSFYARVFHPAFNVDAEEAAQAVEKFDVHTKAVKKGVQHLRKAFGKFRNARADMSVAQRLISYSFLSLITATPMAKAIQTPDDEDDDEDEPGPSARKGAINSHGAWCWRENCEECLRLTKNIQGMSDALYAIADMQEDNARTASLATHEAFKEVAHPDSIYAPVMETHRATLSRYRDASTTRPDEDIAARCETVLNTTMAEFDTYHTQKVEDFERLATAHLDGEIALHEAALARLRAAREAFDYADPAEDSRVRAPSKHERELPAPRVRVDPPLAMPCPHVFDSAPMRPVSVAIQEGVGMLMGGDGRASVASVFGKFW